MLASAELKVELAEIVAGAVDANLDDEHDPEGSTVAFERQRTASLLARAEAARSEIDAALALVASGAYGICEGCGCPIADDRLRARPAARTCAPCAGPPRGLLDR